jgi:hypothetical protein
MKPTKVEEALARAKAAQELSAGVMTLVKAYGMMFEGLLNILKNSAVLTPSQIKGVFFVAAAMVDAIEVNSDLERNAQAAVRATICCVAGNAGIEIPPPGETGVLRKQ